MAYYFDKLFSNVVSNLGRNFSRSFVLCYMRELPAKDIYPIRVISCKNFESLERFGGGDYFGPKIFFSELERNFVFGPFKPWREIWRVFFKSFCTRWRLNIFWREIVRESILNFLSEMFPGETLCRLHQIFPPKVLVYRGHIFS